ncbi:transposable element-related [Holotrichia oblita]|uniref:Transposable element-related n=1 Tax=Holotrichia oblita TaxID=644536 RepID=A0ACB9TE13_HOLOL|nr:transposable element-related [Holotrichia oblita]
MPGDFSSVETRSKIVTLWERGLSYSEVAREVGHSKSVVHYWINRWRTEDQNTALKTRPRSGHPPKIGPEDAGRILQHVSQQPFITLDKIIEELNLNCCAETLRKFLHKQHIHCRRPAKKVELFPRHVADRLNFAHANLNRDWSAVIFSDEVFSTSQDTRKLVWRANGTRFNADNVVRARQSNRISLAYWGWMFSAGPGELTRINTRLDAEEYIRILEDVLLPSVRTFYPEPHPIVLVQDNSAVHTARVVRLWFQHRDDLEVLPWPAKSPDLNPIENLWAVMRQMWDQRDVPIPRNRMNLHNHVTEIWESFRGRETCSNLVASMRERLQEVIDRNGYWTRY